MTSPCETHTAHILENSVTKAVWPRPAEDTSALIVFISENNGRQSYRPEKTSSSHQEARPRWANGEVGEAMNSAGDCEVVVLPKGRGGAICRMSPDTYINMVMSQNAVCSRSVLWPPMTGSTASCFDGYWTLHLLAFSAILCTLRMSLEHWAFWDRIFAAPGRAYLPAARAGPPVIKPRGLD